MRDRPASPSADAPLASPAPRQRHSPLSLPFPLMRRNLPFWRGFFLGIVLLVPLVAVAVWRACQVLVFDADMPVDGPVAALPGAGLLACLRSTSLFGGLAAAITAGGMGRAVWFRSMRHAPLAAGLLTVLAAALAGAALGIVGFTALGLPIEGQALADWAHHSVPLLWRTAAAGGLFGVALYMLCRAPRSSPAKVPRSSAAAAPSKRPTALKRRKKMPARRPRR